MARALLPARGWLSSLAADDGSIPPSPVLFSCLLLATAATAEDSRLDKHFRLHTKLAVVACTCTRRVCGHGLDRAHLFTLLIGSSTYSGPRWSSSACPPRCGHGLNRAPLFTLLGSRISSVEAVACPVAGACASAALFRSSSQSLVAPPVGAPPPRLSPSLSLLLPFSDPARTTTRRRPRREHGHELVIVEAVELAGRAVRGRHLDEGHRVAEPPAVRALPRHRELGEVVRPRRGPVVAPLLGGSCAMRAQRVHGCRTIRSQNPAVAGWQCARRPAASDPALVLAQPPEGARRPPCSPAGARPTADGAAARPRLQPRPAARRSALPRSSCCPSPARPRELARCRWSRAPAAASSAVAAAASRKEKRTWEGGIEPSSPRSRERALSKKSERAFCREQRASHLGASRWIAVGRWISATAEESQYPATAVSGDCRGKSVPVDCRGSHSEKGRVVVCTLQWWSWSWHRSRR
ncbi:hypothetical protein PVAP13_2NG404806 [Panicum virgatum]|uniref:Uncharacterized protein n=1 Tax=Panicum virgatum TaxID=38727 RepID=A0A8T0VWW3_PANVG|nr:hypothetical protein PVAP13_2NG404806 [Panicum virgatum]